MKNFKYLSDVATLNLDTDACIGCGACTLVCPHRVFEMKGKKALVRDKDLCMECGACRLNCPVSAISVTPGVGCASYIIKSWIFGKGNASCC